MRRVCRARIEERDGIGTRLADASMSDVDQRNPHAIYHPMTVDKAQELTPHLDCMC